MSVNLKNYTETPCLGSITLMSLVFLSYKILSKIYNVMTETPSALNIKLPCDFFFFVFVM